MGVIAYLDFILSRHININTRIIWRLERDKIMKLEVWKDITDYPNYQVSNLGNVRSLDRYVLHMGNKMFCKGKNIKLTKSNKGYWVFHFSIQGKMKALNVHRLVAQAFIPNPDNKPCVNHLDCNPLNNRVDNLEWCTQSENIKYSFKLGRGKCNFLKRLKGDKE